MLLSKRSLLQRFSNCRAFSSEKKSYKRSVFISQSKDIYTNLALEDWLYRHFDFTTRQILMLWQNSPCVVIGRHQNPWLEANISEEVQLARRNSGGGTVYHDEGNLNLTFFTNRDQYHRKTNLEVITRALFKEYGLQLAISPKEDLTLRNFKVSGTAAKLGRPNAYHHCTLLVNSNKTNLSKALHSTTLPIETNATKSVKSPVLNLAEEDPEIKVEDLYQVIGEEYLKGGDSTLLEQFEIINPDERSYPGIGAIREQLLSWEWRFGKSPKFKITLKDSKITVENGKISDISTGIKNNVIGHRFSEQTISDLLEEPNKQSLSS